LDSLKNTPLIEVRMHSSCWNAAFFISNVWKHRAVSNRREKLHLRQLINNDWCYCTDTYANRLL